MGIKARYQPTLNLTSSNKINAAIRAYSVIHLGNPSEKSALLYSRRTTQ